MRPDVDAEAGVRRLDNQFAADSLFTCRVGVAIQLSWLQGDTNLKIVGKDLADK